MTRIKTLIVLAVIIAAIGSCGVAHAALVSFFNQAYTGDRNDYAGTVGYDFTPASNIAVVALGRPASGSMNQSHTLSIWRNSDQALMCYVTVTPSSPTDALGFKYEMLAAQTTLQKNVSYAFVSEEFAGGDAWMNWHTGGTPNHTAIATIDGGICGAPGLTYPTAHFVGPDDPFVAPNFYTSGVAPDAGTISGTVRSSDPGNPVLGGAQVSVQGGTSTDADDNGIYSLELDPGTYTLTASKLGYDSQTVENVVVIANENTPQDFTLNSSRVSGTVTDAGTGLGIEGASIRTSDGVYSTTTGTGGDYTLRIPSGTWTLNAQKQRYRPASATISVGVNGSVTQNFQLGPGWDLAGDFVLQPNYQQAAMPNGTPWSYLYDFPIPDTPEPYMHYDGTWRGSSSYFNWSTTVPGKVIAGVDTNSGGQKAIAEFKVPAGGVYTVTARWEHNSGGTAYAGIRLGDDYIFGGGTSQPVGSTNTIVTYTGDKDLTVGDVLYAVVEFDTIASTTQVDLTIAPKTTDVGAIKGVVRSSLAGNAPLPGVKVEVFGGDKPLKVYTAADGSYSVNVHTGVPYDIEVSRSGYQTDVSVMGVTLTDGGTSTHNYTLQFASPAEWDLVRDWPDVALLPQSAFVFNPDAQWSFLGGNMSGAQPMVWSCSGWQQVLGPPSSSFLRWIGPVQDHWSAWIGKNWTGGPLSWNLYGNPAGYLEKGKLYAGGGLVGHDSCPRARWTSPDRRVVKLDLTIVGADQSGTVPQSAEIRMNGTKVKGASLLGFGTVATLPTTQLLVNPGDTIDFVFNAGDWQMSALEIRDLRITQGSGVTCNSIADLKAQSPGTNVFLVTPTTAVTTFGIGQSEFTDNSFFLEADDRSQGIKCIGDPNSLASFTKGQKITFTGKIIADPYDATSKAVLVTGVTSITNGTPLEPLGLNSKAVSARLTARNMLVTLWGKLVERNPADIGAGPFAPDYTHPWNYWVINDGGQDVKLRMDVQGNYMCPPFIPNDVKYEPASGWLIGDYLVVTGILAVDNTGTLVLMPIKDSSFRNLTLEW